MVELEGWRIGKCRTGDLMIYHIACLFGMTRNWEGSVPCERQHHVWVCYECHDVVPDAIIFQGELVGAIGRDGIGV